MDYDNDTVKTLKIEPTIAEAEAIARGLQVPPLCLILVIDITAAYFMISFICMISSE